MSSYKSLLSCRRINNVTGVNNYREFRDLYGCDITDKSLMVERPELYVNIFKSLIERIYPQQFWYTKSIHYLGLNKKGREAFEKVMKNFGSEDVDHSWLSMESKTRSFSLYKLIKDMEIKIKENKSLKRKTNLFIYPCTFPIIKVHNRFLSDKIGKNIYDNFENESANSKGILSLSVEIDFHDINGYNLEEQARLEVLKEKLYDKMANCPLPGTLEMFSARSYYVTYTFDLSISHEEALDALKALVFFYYKEMGLLCDVSGLTYKRLKRLPLMYHQRECFKYVTKPVRVLNNFYDSTKMLSFLKSYVGKYNNEYRTFCSDQKINPLFAEWVDLNTQNQKMEYKPLCNPNTMINRQNNFDRMQLNPIDVNRIRNNKLNYIACKNIFSVRQLLGIKDYQGKKLSSYEVIKTFVKEYGNKLNILLGIPDNKLNKSIHSPLYDDRHPSFILNRRNGIQYAYHFNNDYPSGDIVDIIEYGLGYYKDFSEKESRQKTIDFLAELMNVKVETSIVNKKEDINFVTHKKTYMSLIKKIMKKLNVGESFLDVAKIVYRTMHDNYLKVKMNGYDLETIVTNDYLNDQIKASKATISRYVTLMIALGLVDRVIKLNDKILNHRQTNRNLLTVLKFNKLDRVENNIDRVFNYIKTHKKGISRWNSDTYAEIFTEDELKNIYGEHKTLNIMTSKNDDPFGKVVNSPDDRKTNHCFNDLFEVDKVNKPIIKKKKMTAEINRRLVKDITKEFKIDELTYNTMKKARPLAVLIHTADSKLTYVEKIMKRQALIMKSRYSTPLDVGIDLQTDSLVSEILTAEALKKNNYRTDRLNI